MLGQEMKNFSRRRFLKLAGHSGAACLTFKAGAGVLTFNPSPAYAEESVGQSVFPQSGDFPSVGVNLDARYPVLNSYSPPNGENSWRYMVDRCVEAGVDTVRVDLTRWQWVERFPISQPGMLFDTHASVIASDTILPMLKEAGIKVYTMLRQDLPDVYSSPWPINQNERDHFWRYCQWFLDRWGIYLDAVELLNEPEQPDLWRFSKFENTYVRYYADFVRDIGGRVKNYYPDIQVVAFNNNNWSNFNDSLGWIRRIFEYAFPNPGEWNQYFDEIGVHYYFTGEEDFTRTRMTSWVTQLHDYFSKKYNFGNSIPISLTETGSTLRPSNPGFPGYPDVSVEDQQLWMRNTFQALRDMPFLKSLIFYELFENTEVSPETREAHYCYIKRDYTELPTMATLEEEIVLYKEYLKVKEMDLNGNRVIDPGDMSALRSILGQSSTIGDFNNNGIVDPSDLSLMKSYFGKKVP